MFKKTTLALAVAAASFALPMVAIAADNTGPEFASSANAFFEESTVSGAIGVWMRNRTRGSVDASGNDQAETPNLDHGSLYLTVNFNSGYVADTVGLDLNVYTTFDMWQNGSPDHEMNFWGVDNPYDMNPTSESGCNGTWESSCNQNGGQIQTAAAKFKFGNMVTAKAGWFQPSVPSAMGVNWSFAAGTYTGGEVGLNVGDFKFGLVVADQYRAPWFKDSYEFRDGENNDAGTAYSIGGIYTITDRLSVDIAYAGLSDGDRQNFHAKLKYTTVDGIYISPQLYVVDDEDQYDSTAYQLALLTAMSKDQYSFRAEATYTAAESNENNVGNMAYRLTEVYGASNGAYDIWWNNRSDFNHDGEAAFFASVERDFSDMGATGFSAGVSGVYAFGAKDDSYDELIEYSYSVFLNYAFQTGSLKGASMGMYYTDYTNDSNADNWAGYTNAFQDETDLKVTLVVPFTIK